MTGSARVALRSATAAAFTGLLTMGGVGLFWLAGSGALDAVRTSGPDAPADLSFAPPAQAPSSCSGSASASRSPPWPPCPGRSVGSAPLRQSASRRPRFDA